jgi:hypothetical protein
MFRIYRLPGSRKQWLIDSGPGTMQYTANGVDIAVPSHSVDSPTETPRAWLEVDAKDMFIMDNRAVFPGVAWSGTKIGTGSHSR